MDLPDTSCISSKRQRFLAGRQRKFRMNYFIDSSRLEIEEKNRHTAIELASVIPSGW
jgi:hypothetical protein